MNLDSGARAIPRRLRASHDGTVKERGEQDARDRLSIFIGCQCPGVPRGDFGPKASVLVGGRVSAPDLACQSFRPLHRSDAPAFSRSASSLFGSPAVVRGGRIRWGWSQYAGAPELALGLPSPGFA